MISPFDKGVMNKIIREDDQSGQVVTLSRYL